MTCDDCGVPLEADEEDSECERCGDRPLCDSCLAGHKKLGDHN